MPSITNVSDFAAGRLQSRLSAGTTTGVKLTSNVVNNAAIVFPTTAFRLIIKYTSNSGELTVEKIGVASGTTQSGSTVTLGTLTRNLSLTDGSDFTSQSSGQVFPAGATVYIPAMDTHFWENTPFKDIANTFTAAQTVAAPLIVSGTSSYIEPPRMTTAQRDALPAGNSKIIYNTDTNTHNQYIGGAWTDFAAGATSSATESSEGKVELATLAEHDPTTTGAKVVQAKNTIAVPSATQSDDEYKIPRCESDGLVNAGFLGTGTKDSTTYLAGDQTYKAVATLPNNYNKVVYCSGNAAAGVGASSTSEVDIGTHQYTIPANDLVAGVAYRLNISGLYTQSGNPDVAFYIKLGSTTIASATITTLPVGEQWSLQAIVHGTTTAGASAAAKANLIGGVYSNSATNEGFNAYGTANVATNGTLVLKVAIAFNASHASNVITAHTCSIERLSTTVS